MSRRQHHRTAGRSRRSRRGVIFITALGIIVILTGLVLVFAQSMRTEAAASGYRLSETQADAVEQGAENWVLAQTEAYLGDAVTITEQPAEAVRVGNGYFWILHPDPAQDQQFKFGITDENGKLNLNTINTTNTTVYTNFPNEVVALPNMNQTVADNICAWVDQSKDSNGAQTTTYSSLPEPYQSRYGIYEGTGYETPEELMLVQGMTSQILYGSDLNHNGVIDSAEQALAGTSDVMGNTTTNDTRGIFNYITCFGQPPPATGSSSSSSTGNQVNISSLTQNVLNDLRTLISNTAGSSVATSTVALLAPVRGQARKFTSITSFYQAIQGSVSLSQFLQFATQLTTGTTGGGATAYKVNVNTAPEQVLNCLLAQGEAASLIGIRASADTTQAGWYNSAIQSNTDVSSGVLDQLTTTSYQYSADIVAVSGDGRAFKRVRIVVDASPMVAGTPAPAKIVYRKNLTSLGWPLDPQIRATMRAGQPPPDVNSTQNTITY